VERIVAQEGGGAGAVYGELGKGFITWHHTVPVSQLLPGQMTKVSHLALRGGLLVHF
jgi:hypothetical protein